MAKKIVLFADGTGNAFSTQESNIWRLSEALKMSNETTGLYLAGVGTSSFKPWALIDSATGLGVPGNVRQLYAFLCENYEPDSKIYMFGFSRGAFTIRALIGLIESQGIICREQVGADDKPRSVSVKDMEDYAAAAYIDYRLKTAKSWDWKEKPPLVYLVHGIRKLIRAFYKPKYEGLTKFTEPHIEFVGLFDTVEAFGVPINEMRQAIDRLIWPISFRNGSMSLLVKRACHALSLDDERTSFHPLRIEPAKDETKEAARARIKEVWFAGAHSDVGGGYPDGDLSYVPLVWMLGELNKGDGLPLRPDAVERWNEAANAFAPKHDSRSMIGALYRYAPRSTQTRSRFGEAQFDPPVVHYSVIERIAFGNDHYAPTPLTKDSKLLLPDGTVSDILSDEGVLPGVLKEEDSSRNAALALPYKALKALDGPKQTIIDKAQDGIWWRRLAYFAMVGLLGAFLALPAYADGLSDWLCNLVDGWVIVPYWLRAWEGFGNAIGPILGFIIPNVAGYVGPYLTTLRQHPAIFLVLLIFIVWLYLKSDRLAKSIGDLTYRAWTKHGDEKKDGARSWAGKIAHWLRSNGFSKGAYGLIGEGALPFVWAGVLVVCLGMLFTRVIFDFRSGANLAGFCEIVAQDKLQTVGEAAVEARTEFRTNNPCWPSGLHVTKGQKYRLKLTITQPWVDRTVVTDAAGFETGFLSDRTFTVWRPLLRWAFDPWFHTMGRIIGDRGFEEWPLAFRNGKSEAIEAPALLGNIACPATPKRYDGSAEYCAAHGYDTAEKCAALPLKLGNFEPLDAKDIEGVANLYKNALDRESQDADCRNLPKTRDQFTAEFEARKTGQFFLFVNDVMPVLGFVGNFYANNLGAAKVTLQRIPPDEEPAGATVAKAALR